MICLLLTSPAVDLTCVTRMTHGATIIVSLGFLVVDLFQFAYLFAERNIQRACLLSWVICSFMLGIIYRQRDHFVSCWSNCYLSFHADDMWYYLIVCPSFCNPHFNNRVTFIAIKWASRRDFLQPFALTLDIHLLVALNWKMFVSCLISIQSLTFNPSH